MEKKKKKKKRTFRELVSYKCEDVIPYMSYSHKKSVMDLSIPFVLQIAYSSLHRPRRLNLDLVQHLQDRQLLRTVFERPTAYSHISAPSPLKRKGTYK
jgi:hypothetical protein